MNNFRIGSVEVSDRYHRRSFALPGNPENPNAPMPTADQVVTSDGSPWNGCITVAK